MFTRVTTLNGFHITAAASQWIGCREQQEDACALHPSDENGGAANLLAILADGMGGVADGEKASRHLIDSFLCAYVARSTDSPPSPELLANSLAYANQSLGDQKREGRIDHEAGATFIALSISNHGVHWLNVGDSLLYLQQGNRITKINTAHTWQWELERRVNAGEMTPEAAAAAPGPRHALYAAVCGDEYVDAEVAPPDSCRMGDRYIIASDGLQPLINTGWEPLLNSPEVRNAPPNEVCTLLMNKLMLLQSPHQDNTTIIVVDIQPPSPLADHYAAISLIGDRSSQQDHEGCWKSDNATLAVVADGAGGHSGGERASQLAVKTMQQIWSNRLTTGAPPEQAAEILSQGLIAAHREIIKHAGGSAKLSGKCAIVALYLCNGHYTVANVGDCRAYLAHNNTWQQLTVDDSLLRILIKSGEVSPEEARNHPDQSVLTQALGGSSQIKPHVSSGGYEKNDRFLLCCDGLWNQLPEKLWDMSHWQAATPAAHAELLNSMGQQAVSAALGKSDNVSAIWLHTLPQRRRHARLIILTAAALLLGLVGSATAWHIHRVNEEARIAQEAEAAKQKATAEKEQAKHLLQELGINEEQYDSTILTDYHSPERLALLITAGANVNTTDEHGWSPLHMAAGDGLAKCVLLLLAAPDIDVNLTDSSGDTPLCWAADEGHAECVKLLLAAPGIDVNKTDKEGKTPLFRAIHYGHTECAELIRAAGGRE